MRSPVTYRCEVTCARSVTYVRSVADEVVTCEVVSCEVATCAVCEGDVQLNAAKTAGGAGRGWHRPGQTSGHLLQGLGPGDRSDGSAAAQKPGSSFKGPWSSLVN